MNTSAEFDAWSAAQSYEAYMGRWDRRIAAKFVEWLEPPRDAAWLEIGCGTGALTATILAECAPQSIVSIDASGRFRRLYPLRDRRQARPFRRGGRTETSRRRMPASTSLPRHFSLNFIPDRPAALAELQRVLKPNGVLSFYVWDYPTVGLSSHRRLLEGGRRSRSTRWRSRRRQAISVLHTGRLGRNLPRSRFARTRRRADRNRNRISRFRGALAPLYARSRACPGLLRWPNRGTSSTSEGAPRRGSRNSRPHPPHRAGVGHRGSAGAGGAADS